MDKLTVTGILLACFAILLGYKLEGGLVENLFNFPALIIVVGGSVGAVMLQSTRYQFVTGLSGLKWIFIPPNNDLASTKVKLKKWSSDVRQHGYLILEEAAKRERDPIIKRALDMLVDGAEKEVFCDVVENDIHNWQKKLKASSQIYAAMGGYSPTLGILGAVLGLIQAMSFIKQPDMLGAGIATAFVATIYGVGFANLVFIPIANKLNTLIEIQREYYEMYAEGLLSILLGETPNAIEQRLTVYTQKEPKFN